MSKQKTNEKKKMNPIIWFLFAVIIPLIMIIAITSVALGIAGFNVIDWSKDKLAQVPGVSSIVSSNEDEKPQTDVDNQQSKLKQKDEEIQNLNQQVDDLETINNRLEQKIVKLEKNSLKPAENKETEEPDMLETMSQSFKDMDSQQAARILTDLDQDTATSLLKELSNKDRGEILGEMDPKKAAELTQKLINDNP